MDGWPIAQVEKHLIALGGDYLSFFHKSSSPEYTGHMLHFSLDHNAQRFYCCAAMQCTASTNWTNTIITNLPSPLRSPSSAPSEQRTWSDKMPAGIDALATNALVGSQQLLQSLASSAAKGVQILRYKAPVLPAYSIALPQVGMFAGWNRSKPSNDPTVSTTTTSNSDDSMAFDLHMLYPSMSSRKDATAEGVALESSLLSIRACIKPAVLEVQMEEDDGEFDDEELPFSPQFPADEDPQLEAANIPLNNDEDLRDGESKTAAAQNTDHITDDLVPAEEMALPSVNKVVHLHGSIAVSNQAKLADLRTLALSHGVSTTASSSAPAEDLQWAVVLELLRPQDLALILRGFLLETKIIIIVRDLPDLSLALLLAEFMQAACFPLRWQHIYAPTVSLGTALQLLPCPAPYLLGATQGIYQQHMRSTDQLPIEDAVIVNLAGEQAVVTTTAQDKLLDAFQGQEEWLVNRLKGIAQPQLTKLRQSMKMPNLTPNATTTSTATSADLDDILLRFPEHLLNLPAIAMRSSWCPVLRSLQTCRQYVRCLLFGIEHCCYPTQLPCSRKRRTSTSESAPAAEELFREVDDEYEDTDTDIASSSGDGEDQEEDPAPAPPARAAVKGQAASMPESEFEKCVLFDEHMFVDLKAAQSMVSPMVQGARLQFSEQFLRCFLRSQCLSHHISSSQQSVM